MWGGRTGQNGAGPVCCFSGKTGSVFVHSIRNVISRKLFNRKMTIMSEIDSSRATSVDADFTAYPLLDAIVHVMGNGLVTILGYTQLLQKAISTQEQVACSPELAGW